MEDIAVKKVVFTKAALSPCLHWSLAWGRKLSSLIGDPSLGRVSSRDA